MASPSKPLYLSEKQQHEVCAILTVGCDRETAAHFVNCSLADLRREITANSAFAADVRRAEATSEVTHMRNVQSAAREEKNWRASVWWLERHSPHRYGRRDAGTLTPGELKTYTAMLVSMVVEEVRAEDDVQRLLARFNEVIRLLDELPGDEVSFTELTPSPSSDLTEVAHEGDLINADFERGEGA